LESCGGIAAVGIVEAQGREGRRPVFKRGKADLNDRKWVTLTQSNLCSLRKFESVFNVHSEVSDCAFNFGVTEQDLNST
jgi:hypothetical protein